MSLSFPSFKRWSVHLAKGVKRPEPTGDPYLDDLLARAYENHQQGDRYVSIPFHSSHVRSLDPADRGAQ